MSKYTIYQSKILSNNSIINNTSTSNDVTILADNRDIMGSLQFQEDTQIKSSQYYTDRDLLKDDQFICSLIKIGAKIICGRTVCPENQDVILKDKGKDFAIPGRFEITCGCAREEDGSWYDWFSIGPDRALEDPDKFLSGISTSVRAMIDKCAEKVTVDSFRACLQEKGVYLDLDYLESLAEDPIIKVTQDVINKVREELNGNIDNIGASSDIASDLLHRFKTALEAADINFGGQAGLDKITEVADKIAACGSIDGSPCEAKIQYTNDIIKSILSAIKREKKCYDKYPPGFDPYPPEAPYEGISGLILNQETCECECDKPGYTKCEDREFCIKCGENAHIEKRLAIPTIATWTCGCACDHGFTNHRIPGSALWGAPEPDDPGFWHNPHTLSLYTKCLPECNSTGHQFVEVPCDRTTKTPSFFEMTLSGKKMCYDCACIKQVPTVGGNPLYPNNPKILDEECNVPDSQLDARLNCECNCTPPLVKVDNPRPIEMQVALEEDPFICMERCIEPDVPDFDFGQCISKHCADRYRDEDIKKRPPSSCPGLQHLDPFGCFCRCADIGENFLRPVTVNGKTTCECVEPLKLYLHPKYPPNNPGDKPRRPPIYGRNFRCRHCEPNETYNWNLDRCIPKASGPSNLQLPNIQSLGYNLSNDIEVI